MKAPRAIIGTIRVNSIIGEEQASSSCVQLQYGFAMLLMIFLDERLCSPSK